MLTNWEKYSAQFKINVSLHQLNAEGWNKFKEFDFLKSPTGQTIYARDILLPKLAQILGNSRTARVFNEHVFLLETLNFKDPKFLNERNKFLKSQK